MQKKHESKDANATIRESRKAPKHARMSANAGAWMHASNEKYFRSYQEETKHEIAKKCAQTLEHEGEQAKCFKICKQGRKKTTEQSTEKQQGRKQKVSKTLQNDSFLPIKKPDNKRQEKKNKAQKQKKSYSYENKKGTEENASSCTLLKRLLIMLLVMAWLLPFSLRWKQCFKLLLCDQFLRRKHSPTLLARVDTRLHAWFTAFWLFACSLAWFQTRLGFACLLFCL